MIGLLISALTFFRKDFSEPKYVKLFMISMLCWSREIYDLRSTFVFLLRISRSSSRHRFILLVVVDDKTDGFDSNFVFEDFSKAKKLA